MRDIKTCDLIELLTKAIREQNQELINKCAYELTVRLYVPKKGYSFDDILEGFGYKEIIDDKQISIEDYMRDRKKLDNN